jgi:lysophospholipase L1-like esterase
LRISPVHLLEINNPYKYTKLQRISPNTYVEIYSLIYDTRGYYKKSDGIIRYTLNKFGARSNTSNLINNKNNIIFLGDSLTYGFGLRNEDTYPYLLQQQLKQNHIECESINFAKPAFNTIKNLALYKELYKKIPHNLLIYGLHLNDLINFPTSKIINEINHSYNPESRPLSALYRYIMKLIETKKQRKKNVEDILKQGSLEYSQFRDNIEAIRKIKIYADEIGVPFIVVILPVLIDLENYPLQSIHETLYEIFKNEKIDYLDVTTAFINFKDKNLWILPYDQHPNEIATRIIAKVIYRKIKTYYEDLGEVR